MLLGSITHAEDDPAARREELAKAFEQVRAFEAELVKVVAKVAPTVGAVSNFGTMLDPKTGRVRMQRRGAGSGVVISREGFFLTNVHVVQGAGYITVTLPDGKIYPADLFADTSEGQVKGDIAVLKLRGAKSFPFVDWRAADLKHTRPGELVFAMGNPYSHASDGTPVVTMGILSGKGRAASSRGYLYVGVLQTDAAINPGNSGGPLFNSSGELLGINGLMQSRAGRSNSGIGFAIPMDQVRLFLKRLLRREGEAMAYGSHGLEVETAEGESGALVRHVHGDSPADQEGIRRGDVVISVNGKRIRNKADFLSKAANLPEKTFVRVTYMRRRKKRTAAYRVVDSSEFRVTSNQPKRYRPHEAGYLGLHWRLARNLVFVERVLSNTGAAKAKLAPDDRIVSIDGETVESGKRIFELLSFRTPGEKVKIAYERGGREKTVTLVLCDVQDAAEIE